MGPCIVYSSVFVVCAQSGQPRGRALAERLEQTTAQREERPGRRVKTGVGELQHGWCSTISDSVCQLGAVCLVRPGLTGGVRR